MKTLLLLLVACLCAARALPQAVAISEYPISTAVPFVGVHTDARSAGMGEIAVVSNSANQPVHLLMNPSLLAGRQRSIGVTAGLYPWLRNIQGPYDQDNMLIDHGFYYSINNKNCVSYNFRYLKRPAIRFTNVNGDDAGEFQPKEFLFQVRYARLLSKKFSIGAGFKYIHSDLANGQTIAGVDLKTGRSYAGDIGFDYRDIFKMTDKAYYRINAAFAIQNLGSRISYVDSSDYKGDFIPTVLNFGVMNSFEFKLAALDSGLVIRLDLGYQADKLLVPTPSDADDDANNIPDYQEKPYMKAVFGSFADAPGGAEEEFHEFVHHVGFGWQVMIQKKYFVGFNLGATHENENKGNRRYFQLSPSVGVFGFFFDFAYLVPFDSTPVYEKTWQLAFGYQIRFKDRPLLRFL